MAQGIGMALYEHAVYDENGQLLTGTLLDYLIPTAADVPQVEIAHLESPSPYVPSGIKGMGEAGAIAPPAAIANAVADALRPFGVRVNSLPLSPERVWPCSTEPERTRPASEAAPAPCQRFVARMSSGISWPALTISSSSRYRLQPFIGRSMWQAVSFVPPSSVFGPVENRTLP